VTLGSVRVRSRAGRQLLDAIDSPARQMDDAMRSSTQLEIVRHDDECRSPLPVQFEEQVRDLLPGRAVEISRRLVSEQDHRLVRERTGNPDTLLFTARQLRRIVIEPASEADAPEKLARRRFRIGSGRRAIRGQQFQWNEHVLERCQRRDQMKVLEDEADPIRAQRRPFVFIERRQRNASDLDFTVTRAVEPGEEPEKGRLARARRAEHDHDLALLDLQVDPVEDGECGIRSRFRSGSWTDFRRSRNGSMDGVALSEIASDDHAR